VRIVIEVPDLSLGWCEKLGIEADISAATGSPS
jgi:hypothetical protein